MNNKYLYKKFALSFLFSLTILFCHISKSHAGKYGTGEIKLSNAVVNYLVEKGIDKRRLVAVGYGASKPSASNETVEGRARNRRIEMRILELGK